MGGILSLVWPSSLFKLNGSLGLTDREESPDILLAAIRIVDPRLSFYAQVSQNLPPHSAVRRTMEEELKRLETQRVMEGDEEDNEVVYLNQQDPTSSGSDSDSECSVQWEEYSDDDDSLLDITQPQSLKGDDYKFTIRDEHAYSRLLSDVRAESVYGEDNGNGDYTKCVLDMRRKLELGHKGRDPYLPSPYKASLVNKFLPNRRHHIATHTSKLFCCEYLPTQQQVVVTAQDAQMYFYGRGKTPGKWQLERVIEVPNVAWTILDTSFSRDGNTVAYSTWSDSVYLTRINNRCDSSINNENRQWNTIPVCHSNRNSRGAIFSIQLSNNETELLCGTADYDVYVIDIETSTKKIGLSAHADDTNCVHWGDDDDNIIITAGDDGLCKVWDRRLLDSSEGESEPVGIFAGHRDGITCVDTRGDGRYLLTNSKDQTLKVWDLRRFSSYDGVNNTRRAVAGQTWDYRWQTCPSSCRCPCALEGDSSVATLTGHSVLHTLVRARWSPKRTGGRYIYTGCARGDVIVYDMVDMKPLERLAGHKATVRDCVWSTDTNEIYTTSWDGGLAVWQWDERRVLENVRSGEEEESGIKTRRIRLKLTPKDKSAKRRRMLSNSQSNR